MCDYRPAKAAIWWQMVQRSILNCLRAGWLRLGKEIHMGWQSERIGTMHRRCKDDMEHALMLFKLKCWGAQVWWHGIMIFDFFFVARRSKRVFAGFPWNGMQCCAIPLSSATRRSTIHTWLCECSGRATRGRDSARECSPHRPWLKSLACIWNVGKTNCFSAPFQTVG